MIGALFGDLIPYIVVALATVAGIWGWGKVKRREGVKDERAAEAQRDAADFAKTIKDVADEKDSDDPADAIRRRMRDRAKR